MKKKILISLTIPIIGMGTYLGLSVLMPVAEPTTGVTTERHEQRQTVTYWAKPIVPGSRPDNEVVITSDNHYLSMSVENINVTVNATKSQKEGGDER